MSNKRMIKIPRGAKVGPEQRPLYGWAEVEADCKDGLCVHPTLIGIKWVVTHEASGLRLDALTAKTKRRALANRAAALTIPIDWTRSDTEVLLAMAPHISELRAIGSK